MKSSLDVIFLHYLDDLSGCLVESLDRRQHSAVQQGFGFGQHSCRAILIDVKAENLTSKFTLHYDVAGADRASGKSG